MKKLLTAAQMQAADHATIQELGIPGIVLMEHAGLGIVRTLEENIPDFQKKKFLVVCGPGNNGGDGFVIARLLHQRGMSVNLMVTGQIKALKGEAGVNALVASRLGIPILELTPKSFAKSAHQFRHGQVIVDALFGTGLTRPVTGLPAQVIKKINASGKFVVAVDIPSGLDSDTGQPPGIHVSAHLTCALAEYKRSHWLFPAAEFMGQVFQIDIGIPGMITNTLEDQVALMERTDIAGLLPKRRKNTHKGTYGHLLVIAGSRGKEGAGGLTSLAGLRVGTGLVTLAGPSSLRSLSGNLPLEVMTEPLAQTPGGSISEEAVEPLLDLLKSRTALALGPGLGTAPTTLKFLEAFLPKVKIPMVIDADGLNLIARSKTLLKNLPAGTILTPHPREMSRLTGVRTAHILKNRLQIVQAFCQQTRTHLVLKGAHTLIGLPDGRVRINPTGNAGMATAGSGDILTGIIGGLLAQGLSPEQATLAGVYLHGLSGDLYCRNHSEATLIAGDLADTLSHALQEIQR